jgi:hydrogenase expression/formation protein HypC
MCLSVPGRIVEIVDDEKGIATVEAAGARRNVSLALLQGDERPKVGDFVLFHTGFALSKIDDKEAAEIQEVLEAITRNPFHDELESRQATA